VLAPKNAVRLPKIVTIVKTLSQTLTTQNISP
jgi:hypothetical protein